ncbi:L,D-transpeptidase/peptidoglycan binding protein [Clostridium estertheticum]|uniref:L,D-transpeptidase family protein n=1 Tax=Clostridium estertheticum TaxID=238834 RepID=UPI001CD0815B|nr:L,D-transpeptidase family protein [Clostridium estertheticum]MBZ9685660.1 L,D-transpeptidase/peptidoglycan binding protein [Clostridium estertheticum]MBZ9685672.1 L,D-transpeptidase/peptidoglycan binding protein [Clostridium estertheticum]
METEVEKSTKRSIKKRKKIVLGIIISICTLLIIYFGMAIYFMNHFYFGSTINRISVSGKSVEAVNEQMASEIQKYQLNIKERGGINEQITGEEIGLKYDMNGEFKEFKDKQNPYKWISVVFNTKDSKMIVGVKYDKDLLKEHVNKLSCFDSSKVIEPKNAGYKYIDNGYVIVDEVIGNKGDKDILYKNAIDAITKGETTIDLESINYYVKPQYTSKSPKVVATRDKLNKYVSSKITYIFGGDKEILDGSTINKWVTVDENSEVTFNEKQVEIYMDVLASEYNTVAKTRNFVSSSGKVINIGGGSYGFAINKVKETQDLISMIMEGKSIEREPAYYQTALSRGKDDIGNTYVEIDLSRQHLWFYKNGVLITQGDVVTGNDGSDKTRTPVGIYMINYKERNATLKGEDYAAPVNYWLPFNGGIGIHDASWRDKFGGVLYKTGGSHGCINSPYDVAKTIFNNIEAGTPVVCY